MRREWKLLAAVAAIVAVAAVAGGIWFVRGYADGGPSDGDDEVRIADLGVGGPLLLPHFRNERLYIGGQQVPYAGPQGGLVQAGDAALLRTQDGRVVQIDRDGKVTQLGTGAADTPVVSGWYAAWSMSPIALTPSHTAVTIWNLVDGRLVGEPAFPFPFPPVSDGPPEVTLAPDGRVYLTDPEGDSWAWDARDGMQRGQVPAASVPAGAATDAVRSPGGKTAAWFDDSALLLGADNKSHEVGWPTDAEPGEIVWESDQSFVVLPGSADQPVIRCYAANAGCRVVAAD